MYKKHHLLDKKFLINLETRFEKEKLKLLLMTWKEFHFLMSDFYW